MASILFKVVRIFNSHFKCNYLKNEKLFLEFLFQFSILHEILNFLKEKMIVIANVFPKFHTLKIFVRKLSQEHRLRAGFGSQHLKVSQLLAKSPRERFYHVLLSFSGKLIWNFSPLVSGEILGMFFKTLTADGKYPVQGCENLQFPIKMQLFEKHFLKFLFHFWILHQVLNILKEKMIVRANVFPKLQTVKIFLTKLSQERRFRTGLGSQPVKASELLAKSPRERFYHVVKS